ncbi:MAG TPA: 3-dehydroquinate synthase [Burkholderiales bacterium]
MRTLTVELGPRSYPIHIGSGLYARPELVAPLLAARGTAIVTNATVGALYLPQVRALLGATVRAEVTLPDGEQHKTLATVERIVGELLAARCDRNTLLIALGGGVVGDIGGFAAACYQRGIDFLQLPTTLLAQVDSSVGGKTGVNHALGKNMIGAFHQPRAVIIDTDTLRTLPEREFRAGLAEVIKYGLIRDAEFFDWCERHLPRLLARDAETLAFAIERSCRNKAQVVALDERESGVRALLNLGHTFGHAVEAGVGYGEWLHGEAVAAGMVAAAELSCRLGWLKRQEYGRIERVIAAAGLPTRLPAALEPARMRALMTVDKKAAAGRVRFVLLRGIGDAFVSADVPGDQLERTLAACRAEG